MKKSDVRVRFAPAPTGMMHLGNVRAALMNYLFANAKNGTFILRVEDTDQSRNFDPGGKKIIEDLAWLGLTHEEGPDKGGTYTPYLQSERSAIHQAKLDELIENKNVYRCFCTQEELEKKRGRQIALKQPPRYDRTCLKLSEQKIDERLKNDIPFIWRMKLDHENTIEITDLAHGTIRFELKNFSDFPLTRQNGSFTFMFANFVDDLAMNITHVMRGEDHLTNTAGQAALYLACSKPLPTFWHMPILCNIDGKKLSKRDFGFSLRDLKNEGYTPEAICNYLGIIGGSFEQEIMSLEQLAQAYNFDTMHTTGHIRYDVEKLRWVNHKWIAQYDDAKLTNACRPYLEEAFEQAKNLDNSTLINLVTPIKTDLTTLKDCVDALGFYFSAPKFSQEDVQAIADKETLDKLQKLIADNLAHLEDAELFAKNLKNESKEQGIPLKATFSLVRLALMGQTKGPTIHDLVAMLGVDEAEMRLKKIMKN